jgi:hypothetical protein
MNISKTKATRVLAFMLFLVAVLAAMPASQALANPPTMETVHITSTGVAPGFSQACGFTIMRHRDTTITLRSFTDHNGNLVREVENFRETGYFSANGITLDYNQVGPGQATHYPDGSILVASNGLFFNVRLPGGNFHLAGRFWTLVDANDNVIDEGFSGVDHRDIDDFCSALAP